MSQFFQTIENTLTLVGYSITFACRNKKLLIVPIIRSIAGILVFALCIGAAIGVVGYFSDYHGWQPKPGLYEILIGMTFLFVFVFLMAMVSMVGELVLSHAIGNIFRTGQASLKDAMVNGFKRFGRTVIWSGTYAFINMLGLRENNSMLGNFLGDIFVLGWNLATLFIIPVFAFEQLGVYASIKRSAEVFENHFGKAMVAEFSFGRLSLLLALVPLVLLPIAFYFNIVPIFFVLYVLFIIVASAFISLAHAIFTTALYFYATGESTGSFDTRILERSFARKE
jgi:hypothetical protein